MKMISNLLNKEAWRSVIFGSHRFPACSASRLPAAAPLVLLAGAAGARIVPPDLGAVRRSSPAICMIGAMPKDSRIGGARTPIGLFLTM